MCDVLQIPRSTYYYEAKVQNRSEDELQLPLWISIIRAVKTMEHVKLK